MRTFCLRIAAEPELCRGEQPIHDHVGALDAVVDEFGAAFRADDPERRHLALAMPAGNSMNTCRPSSKARSGRQAGLSPSMR